MTKQTDYGKFILNFDPENPHAHKAEFDLAVDEQLMTEDLLPVAIPWPAGSVPAGAPLAKAPAETADLSGFKGYDAVVVTWTAAEAASLAKLFTPGFPPSSWYEYRHNNADYIHWSPAVMPPLTTRQKIWPGITTAWACISPVRLARQKCSCLNPACTWLTTALQRR